MVIMDSNQKGGEMLGVSRSGRIRKKSSKLMDFQNPDEIETKSKKGRKSLAQPVVQNTDESESESISDDVSDENDGDEEEIIDNTNDVNTIRKSLYMQEKSNKKKILKDGKTIYAKTARRDKGKSRFTAFLLWQKETHPHLMDAELVSQSRKLAELWSNVPTSEKLVWRRKAKRMAKKMKNDEQKPKIKQPTTNNVINTKPSSFINRPVYVPSGNPVGRPPKRLQQLQQQKYSKHQTLTQVVSTASVPKEMSKKELDQKELQETLEETAMSIFQTTPVKNAPQIQPGVYKVTGLEPLDVAAHLNLLGESLSIIGERLKEHEGQITVSGSLSVLLDSLLCSLGPLMCLTCAIPNVGTDSDKKLRDNMHKTLDNIAYIMPGL